MFSHSPRPEAIKLKEEVESHNTQRVRDNDDDDDDVMYYIYHNKAQLAVTNMAPGTPHTLLL